MILCVILYQLIFIFQAHIQDLYGDYGMAVCAPTLNIKYLNPLTRTLLIRCARGAHNMVMHALTMIKKIEKWSYYLFQMNQKLNIINTDIRPTQTSFRYIKKITTLLKDYHWLGWVEGNTRNTQLMLELK